MIIEVDTHQYTGDYNPIEDSDKSTTVNEMIEGSGFHCSSGNGLCHLYPPIKMQKLGMVSDCFCQHLDVFFLIFEVKFRSLLYLLRRTCIPLNLSCIYMYIIIINYIYIYINIYIYVHDKKGKFLPHCLR